MTDSGTEWTLGSVRDAKGVGFETLTCGELVLPKPAAKTRDFTEQLRQVRELKYQDSDVIICSYPKTGKQIMTERS